MRNWIKFQFTLLKSMMRSGLRSETSSRTSLTQKSHPKEKVTIVKVLSPLSYELELPNLWKIHPMFHVLLLTPYHKNEIHGPNFPAPPPDLIDNKEYEINQILKHHGPPNNRSFLIRWKGTQLKKTPGLKKLNLEMQWKSSTLIKRGSKSPTNKKHKPPPIHNTFTIFIMSSTYYSNVDHPHPYDPNWIPGQNTLSPARSHSLPSSPPLSSPKSPLTLLYCPSLIPQCQSLQPLSQKSSFPKIIAVTQGTQTNFPYVPPNYPHPTIVAKQVKEHYPDPNEFLRVFNHTLDTLYTTSPYQPHHPTPDVFRENPLYHWHWLLPDPDMPSPREATHHWRIPSFFNNFSMTNC